MGIGYGQTLREAVLRGYLVSNLKMQIGPFNMTEWTVFGLYI